MATNKMATLKLTLMARCVSLALGAASLATATATAAADAQATGDAALAKGDNTLQEIVVTGIRASLEKSLDIKKNSPVVLDSINATELGRFPDADVADSLAHLPGITITRTTGGEGQKVNVRGFGPQYNIVTLNNRMLATDDDARDLAFDVLPSEVISGADVLKSAQASAIEGSIGGTVNLRTASPFENPGLHGGIHAEGNYNSMSKLYGNKFSAFASNTNEAGTLGFLLGAVHSDNKLRTDSLNAYNQLLSAPDGSGPATYPFDGSGNPVPLKATPCCITFGSIFDEKKRDAISGSLEWRPNADFKLVADGLFTRLRDPQRGYNQSYYFACPDSVCSSWSNPTVSNGLVTAATVSGFQPEIVNNTTNRNVDSQLFGLNGSWKPNSRLTLGMDFYHSKADRPEGGADTFVTAGLVSSTPFAQDTLIYSDVPHSLPNLNVLVPPGQLGLTACPSGTASSTNPGSCSYNALMNSGFLKDNKYWSTHYVGLNGYSVKDQINSGALDGVLDVEWGPLNKLQFGVAESHREKRRVDSSNDWTNGSNQYGTLYNTAGCPVQCNPYSFASQGFNVISLLNPPHFMQGAGGSYPGVVPALDVGKLLAFLKSLDGKPNPQTGTTFNFANTLPQPNPVNSYDVTEKTSAFYVQGDFGGNDWSGNFGVRVVHTATTASYAGAVPTVLWSFNNPGSVKSYNVLYAASQSGTSRGSYTLFLPSLNFNYWLMPEKLQLRAAVAETMSRPNLNQLAPNNTNQGINGTPTLSYTGTAGLKPVTAYQADLSLEWYYQPHSALTVGLFGKKLRNDIFTSFTPQVDLGTVKYDNGPPPATAANPGIKFPWNIDAPANGATATFKGVELTWQHFLENGLGAHVQYTRKIGNSTGAVNDVPPITASVSLIYDKGPISADINWDYTSSYAFVGAQSTEVPGWPAISESFEWLTASVHYKFSRGFEVYVEGKNLTNAIARTYLNGNPLLPWAPGQSVGASESGVGAGYTAYGRFFVAGAAYRF